MAIISRMHTAEHIFFRALQNVLAKRQQTLELDKIDLSEQESSCFVFTNNLTWKDLFEAEQLTNTIISENRSLTITAIKHSELEHYKQRFPLRIKEDRIKEDTVRIIEIKDFDWSACNKEHCTTTGQIGLFFVTNFRSIGKNNFNIHFTVEPGKWLYLYSQPARELITAYNTPAERLVSVIQNQKAELEASKQRVRELSKHVIVQLQHESLGTLNLVTGILPGLNQKEFIEKMNSEKKEKTIVCCSNEADRVVIAVIVSDDLPHNANELLQQLFRYHPGKGGGRKELAQGTLEKSSPDIFMTLKKILE